jgi:hypothetical protein
VKRKITDSLAVIALLIIAIACLLPIMESLSGPFPPKSADEEETGEEETSKEKIGEPDKSESEIEQGEKEGGEGTLYSEHGVASLRAGGTQPAEPLFKVRGAENTRLLRSFAITIYDGQIWRFDENFGYRG